jgi:hypothetical protein
MAQCEKVPGNISLPFTLLGKGNSGFERGFVKNDRRENM